MSEAIYPGGRALMTAVHTRAYYNDGRIHWPLQWLILKPKGALNSLPKVTVGLICTLGFASRCHPSACRRGSR